MKVKLIFLNLLILILSLKTVSSGQEDIVGYIIIYYKIWLAEL